MVEVEKLKDYFHFAKVEQQGIIALAVIILILLVIPKLIPFFEIGTQELTISIDGSQFSGLTDKTELAFADTISDSRFITRLNTQDSVHILLSQQETPRLEEQDSSYRELFFDPNIAEASTFHKVGLPKSVTTNILKYRNKGGVFRKKEDLEKIYGMETSNLEKLIPHLQFPVEETKASRKEKIKKVDINLSDAEKWKELPGIGEVLSKRIVTFREKLGGFFSVEQVREVYGLKDSVWHVIHPFLHLNEVNLKKIAINDIELDTLRLHPYLTWKQAEILVLYRQNHGPFNTAEDLLKIEVFDKELVEKLKPYLTF